MSMKATRRTTGGQRARGRQPVAYDPAYCDAVIAHASAGKSPEEFAAQIGVALSILAEWSSVHPEFQRAVALAVSVRAASLEDRLRVAADQAEVDELLRVLERIAPDEWADNREVLLVGLNDDPRTQHQHFPDAVKRAHTARVAALQDRLHTLIYHTPTSAEADAEGERILTLLAELAPDSWDGTREARLVGEPP